MSVRGVTTKNFYKAKQNKRLVFAVASNQSKGLVSVAKRRAYKKKHQ